MGIQPKKKVCAGCGQPQFIWKNVAGAKYCQACYSKIGKPTKVIAKRSTKGILLDRAYAKLRREYLLSSPLCQAHIPNICSYVTTDIHHMRGRGQYYLDVSTWLPVCRSCHDWIELHPKEAKDLGFSQTRL